jgi:RNA polymerase sigma-70 factor (ECF subfamily)
MKSSIPPSGYRAAGAAPGSTPRLDLAMARFAQGDASAFDEVYRQAMPRVRSLLVRMCRDPSCAEDLAQETLLRVSLTRERFDVGAPALPWMFTIARNIFFDFVRRSSVRGGAALEAASAVPHATSNDTHPHQALVARELLGVVQGAIGRLCVRQREAFLMLRVEGLTAAQVARRLGTTEAAIKLRAHRASDALRAAVDAHAADVTV